MRFLHVLSAERLPMNCVDARQAKPARNIAANKTDANDADGALTPDKWQPAQ
jgi:transposase